MEMISLKKIKAMCTVGILPSEKEPQEILISLEIDLSNKKVFETGKIEDTVDYAKLVEDVREFVKSKKWDLIENLADDIGKKLLEDYELNFIKITVEKPNIIEGVESISCTVTQEFKASKPMGFSSKI